MGLLAGQCEGATDVLGALVALVVPGDRHPSVLRVEKAQQQIGDRCLAGAAGADDGNAAAGLEAEVESGERRLLGPGIAGGDPLQRDAGTVRRRWQRTRRVGHLGPPVNQIEHPRAGSAHRGQLTGAGGERRDGLERGQREQRQRGDQHGIEPSGGVRGHGDGQHGGHGHAGHRDRERLHAAGHPGVAAGEPGQLAVAVAQRGDRPVGGTERDQLGRAAQQLDQLAAQLAADRCLPSTGAAARRSRPAREYRRRRRAARRPESTPASGSMMPR